MKRNKINKQKFTDYYGFFIMLVITLLISIEYAFGQDTYNFYFQKGAQAQGVSTPSSQSAASAEPPADAGAEKAPAPVGESLKEQKANPQEGTTRGAADPSNTAIVQQQNWLFEMGYRHVFLTLHYDQPFRDASVGGPAVSFGYQFSPAFQMAFGFFRLNNGSPEWKQARASYYRAPAGSGIDLSFRFLPFRMGKEGHDWLAIGPIFGTSYIGYFNQVDLLTENEGTHQMYLRKEFFGATIQANFSESYGLNIEYRNFLRSPTSSPIGDSWSVASLSGSLIMRF